MSKCTFKKRCKEPATKGSFCAQHFAEAMERVHKLGGGEKLKPWSGVVRGSMLRAGRG